jgi:ribosomal-protein-alanine N-acetyltransferase
VIIRQTEEENLNDVYSLALRSLDEYFVPEIFDYFMRQWRRGQLVACLPTGKIIGFIVGSLLGSGRAAVSLFAVDERYRGMGVGTKLLSSLRQRALMEGITTIQLELRTENERALAFYRRNGFAEVEYLPGFYNDGGDGIRMIGPVRTET